MCKTGPCQFRGRNAEVYRIWRYVNAMHCSAYCGLTDHLTEANFFIPLSKKHGLLGAANDQGKSSRPLVRNIDIDDSGVRACSMFEVRLLLPKFPAVRPSTGTARQLTPAGPGSPCPR